MRLAGPVTVLVAISCLVAAEPSSRVRFLTGQGQSLLRGDNHEEAQTILDKAVSLARAEGAQSDLELALIILARTRVALAKRKEQGNAPGGLLDQAAENLSEAANLNRRYQNVALNDWAALEISREAPEPALEILSRINLRQVESPAERAVYQYSQCQALLRLQRFGEAFGKCRLAVQANPRFGSAIDGAIQSLSPELGLLCEAVTFLRTDLAERGQSERAADAALRILENKVWAAHSDAPELVSIVLLHYTKASVSPQDFRATWGLRLHKVEIENRPIEQAVEEVHELFFEEVAIPANRDHARSLFPTLSRVGPQREVLSLVLKSVGDYYQIEKDYPRAMARYCAAWLLDPGNTAAALQTAALIRTDRALDPQVDLLRALIEMYPAPKSGEKVKQFFRLGLGGSGGLQLTAQDRENLARMFTHVAILSKDSEQEDPTYTRYQLDRAVEHEKRTGRSSAGTLMRLGEADAKLGNLRSSSRHYARAAEIFLERCQVKEAAIALERAGKTSPESARKSSHRKLVRRVDQAKEGCSVRTSFKAKW
jgi:tetratricopeptide (TPR) repeat protein